MTPGTDCPVCPYCGAVLNNWVDIFGLDDEEPVTIMCEECDRDYRALLNDDYMFETTKSEETPQ